MKLFNFIQNCIEKIYLFFVAGIPAFLLDKREVFAHLPIPVVGQFFQILNNV